MRQLRFTSVLLLSAGLAIPTGQAADPIAGEKLYQARCKICHTIGEGGTNGIGPNLFGVFERKAGVVEGFRYSKSHRESGLVWDQATLDTYLEDVKVLVPKTKKVFAGVGDADDRASTIDYLKTQR